MKLSLLLARVDQLSAGELENVEISGLAYDSRRVQPGSLFVAIKGMKTDGNLFVSQALKRGAIAVVSEKDGGSATIPWVQVSDARQALARLSSNFYSNPSRQLRLVGITGTNGKTSTAFILDSILKSAGVKSGLISTIEYRGAGGTISADRTTPESLDLQELFARFLQQGCRYVVMEVSSHALALQRVHTCQFRSAVFTNFTPDHLDYHLSMEDYFNAKRQLFVGTGSESPRKAVVNMDDPKGRILAGDCPDRCITFSAKGPADFQALDFKQDVTGMQLHVQTPVGFFDLATRLIGRPNVMNILAAAATAHDLGVDWDIIKKGVEHCPPIPGRFEAIHCGQEFRVVVDYAHTEDALEKLLLTARQLQPERILLLFGCGGDRDRSKRPAMGAVAERLADIAMITSDNPRSEDPSKIIEEIQSGFKQQPAAYITEPDRASAIRSILQLARPNDIVLLAGKGHETSQVLREKTIHFDDREIARNALAEMGYSS